MNAVTEKTAAFAAKLYKSKEKVEINNRLIKGLGYDEARDFFQELGNFGYNSDFTYRDNEATDCQKFLRRFIKDCFID
jgi:hypothetical protein